MSTFTIFAAFGIGSMLLRNYQPASQLKQRRRSSCGKRKPSSVNLSLSIDACVKG